MFRSMFSLLSVLIPATVCFGQVTSVRTGDAAGQPGEVVEVPILASYTLPAQSFVVALAFDAERLDLVGWDADGTAAAGFNPHTRHFNTRAPGVAFIGVQQPGLSHQVFLMPPGDDVLIARALFRVRASAPAGEAAVAPAEAAENARTTFSMRDAEDRLVSGHPESLSGSVVTVAAPQGPRPVSDLTCEQFLDRVVVAFSPTGEYDAIEIARDGEVVAILSGDETEHSDGPVPPGPAIYTVTSHKDGVASFPVACELFVGSPAAPAVKDLSCSNGLLSWTNPVVFDRLSVFRNGEQIADLDGSARSFDDPEPTADLTVYTVISRLGGFESPETHCLDNGLWVVEVGDVQVAPDATRVLVPIFVTNPAAIKGLGLHLDIDQDRFRLVLDPAASLGGTASHPETEIFLSGIGGQFGLPAIGMVFDALPPIEPEKNLPVGLRQHVVNFVFEPVGAFEDGDNFAVSLHQADLTSLQSTTVRPDLLVGGEIRFGSGLPAVADLEASVVGDGGSSGSGGVAGVGGAGSSVVLSWENGDAYDSVRVERNGEPIAEISGDSGEYVDEDVPQGVFTYKVIGVSDGATSFPSAAFLSTVSPPGAFLRGDTTRDGVINLADPIRTLTYLFRERVALACEDAADANDDGKLNLTDSVHTLNYLFRGTTVISSPGTIYPWFDPTPDGLSCRN